MVSKYDKFSQGKKRPSTKVLVKVAQYLITDDKMAHFCKLQSILDISWRMHVCYQDTPSRSHRNSYRRCFLYKNIATGKWIKALKFNWQPNFREINALPKQIMYMHVQILRNIFHCRNCNVMWNNEKFTFAKNISSNQLFSKNFIFTKFLPRYYVFTAVWKNEKFTVTQIFFRQINL